MPQVFTVFTATTWATRTRVVSALRFREPGADNAAMARLWTALDEERLQESGCELSSIPAEADEPIDLLFRDIVRGCIVYFVAALLHRLRIAALPTRSLAAEIKDAGNARAFAAWLRAPISEPPEVFGAIDRLDA